MRSATLALLFILSACEAKKATPAASPDPEQARMMAELSAYNRKTCIANGGSWDETVSIPSTVPGVPFVGWCNK